MKKTKKDLLKEIKELEDQNRAKQNLIYDYRKESTEHEQKIEELERDNKNIEWKSEDKSRILKLVIEILSGEASSTSKTEVLIDLFPEIKKLKEDQKRMAHDTHMGYQHSRF